MESLAVKLEEALPGAVHVQRRRSGLFGPKLVSKISLQAGEDRLELVRRDSNAVETRRARTSGGIVLKSESLDIDQWTVALGQALAAEAQRSERTRQVLERLLTE